MGETLWAGHLVERKQGTGGRLARSATLCELTGESKGGMEEGVDIEVEPWEQREA